MRTSPIYSRPSTSSSITEVGRGHAEVYWSALAPELDSELEGRLEGGHETRLERRHEHDLSRLMRAVAAALWLLSSTVFAEGTETPETVEEEPAVEQSSEEAEESNMFGRVGGFVDRYQRQASQGFNDFVLQVDDFFGADTDGDFSNESWARLRIDVEKPGDEDLDVSGTVKLRIVLPRAERRFRLLLSSEEEDTASSEADVTQPQRLDAEGDGQDVSLALRFIRSARDNGSLNFDLGSRQRDGRIQIFGRINSAVRGDMTRYWYGTASNSYYYYSASGFENKFRLTARRPMFKRDWLYFQSSTGFDWEKGRKGASISQSMGFYAEISERKALAFEALAGYATALNGGASARYRGHELRIRWRHNIWRKWFFYELWPSVSWPSSNDYEQVYGGLIRLEAFVGSFD